MCLLLGVGFTCPSCNESRIAGASGEVTDTGGGDDADRDVADSGDARFPDDTTGMDADAPDGGIQDASSACAAEYSLLDYEGGTMPLTWDLTLVGREVWGRTMTVFVVNSGECAFEATSIELVGEAADLEWFGTESFSDMFEVLVMPREIAPGERFRVDVGFSGYMPYDVRYAATLVIHIGEIDEPIEILFRGVRER